MSTEMNSTDYSALYRQERIRFLQSQINNHFLYTTLESMRGMMAMGKTDAVRSSLTQMATIYRYCSETAIQVPLSDEIRITELYHHLVSTMNPNEIALDIQIPEAVQTRMVPRMLIQPLVENALLHGFLHSGIREGTILVHAEEMNDQLYLKIEKPSCSSIPAGKTRAHRSGLPMWQREFRCFIRVPALQKSYRMVCAGRGST